ncbi:putative periplasmic serine endoprotease DegP-like precursor [Botrimarina colliarenosi]|uniref:Putative periplasmic serine endoprotease DegP-like n=1 Tax=Botrimarina colliarenosi TaxID=2528001 RepID=A0A5C6A2I7_9BACT|nr:trypsin-like peptidase domain-containing protein [Botrimarina colliarenosi]TWT94092.1 putative periplasmic serine endoprotease DegP-like precursor [Botrimarina colliarenosi]
MQHDLEAAADVPAPLPDAPRQMFDKPNLQFSDPDPYAFANRIRKLVVIASLLACLAAAPFFSRVFSYQVRLGQMQAEYETASAAIGELAPQLKAFEEASRSIAKKVGPSVVSINKLSLSRGRTRFEGVGSGFIVDAEGYVITNYHVINAAERLIVRFSNGDSSDASIVGGDERTDLAVLKIDGGNLPAIAWGDSDQLQMGDLVWAVGSPFGLENSITFGIVSATARRRSSGVTDDIYQEFFQSDTAVNPGNSGGPMVNLAGEVIGVNTMIAGEFFRGVSFSIPSRMARESYEQIREKGFIERGFLGIDPSLPSIAIRQRLGLDRGEGVAVNNLRSNTPAADAGLKNNDVILQWNDHKAFDPSVLSQQIASTEVGSSARVVVRRVEGGTPVDKELTVRVGRRTDVER